MISMEREKKIEKWNNNTLIGFGGAAARESASVLPPALLDHRNG